MVLPEIYDCSNNLTDTRTFLSLARACARHCVSSLLLFPPRYRAAKTSTGRNCAIFIVVAVLAAAIPVAYQISKMQTTVNVDLIYPRDSPALHVYNDLKTQVSAGLLAQYFIIAQAPAAGGVWTDAAFNAVQSVSDELVRNGDVQSKDIASIAYFNGQKVPLALASYFFSPAADGNAAALLYRQFFRANTDARNATTLVTIALDFDPLGDEAAPWVRKVRAVLDTYNPRANGNGGLAWCVGR